MMANMFSIFSPSSSLPFLGNWVVLILWLTLPFSIFWSRPPKIFFTFYNWMQTPLLNSMKQILGKEAKILPPLSLLSFFWLIVTCNLFSLLPYVYAPTSHPSLTLVLALPFCIYLFFQSTLIAPTKLIASLVPSGTPPILVPFMVLIETVSYLIRPVTLMVRLTANVVAGHLLLRLLSGFASIFDFQTTFMIIMSGVILTLLETAVAIIQGYVFVVLSNIYLSQV